MLQIFYLRLRISQAKDLKRLQRRDILIPEVLDEKTLFISDNHKIYIIIKANRTAPPLHKHYKAIPTTAPIPTMLDQT